MPRPHVKYPWLCIIFLQNNPRQDPIFWENNLKNRPQDPAIHPFLGKKYFNSVSFLGIKF